MGRACGLWREGHTSCRTALWAAQVQQEGGREAWEPVRLWALAPLLAARCCLPRRDRLAGAERRLRERRMQPRGLPCSCCLSFTARDQAGTL